MLSVAYGYLRFGPGPLMLPVAGAAGLVRKGLGFALQTAGLVAAAESAPRLKSPFAADSNGCPFDFQAEREAAARKGSEVRGLDRVTRHPMLWTLASLGLSVAVRTPFAGTAAAASGPFFVALVGGAHMDSRHRRGMGGSLTAERDAETSHVPFVALATGAQSWTALRAELKETNSLAALGLSSLFALTWLRR